MFSLTNWNLFLAVDWFCGYFTGAPQKIWRKLREIHHLKNTVPLIERKLNVQKRFVKLSRFSRRERGTAEREPAGEILSVVEGSCVERLAGVPTRSEVLSEARVSRLAGVSGAECESSRAKQVPAGEFARL